MNTYGIAFNNGDDLIQIEANYFYLKEGCIIFNGGVGSNKDQDIAMFNLNIIAHCALQKKYTEDEILSDILKMCTEER